MRGDRYDTRASGVVNCGAGPGGPGKVKHSMPDQSRVDEPFVSGLYFGECPRWHEGRLWFSDFYDHRVFSVSPEGDQRTEVVFDGEPAGLGWLPDGRLLIDSRLDRAVFRREPMARWYATAS